MFAGQGRLIEKGFRQGGPAGFGLRRMLIDEHGAIKGVLVRGENKSIQTDRVILTPGPDEEVALVRNVYRAFVHEGAQRKRDRGRSQRARPCNPRLEKLADKVRLSEDNALTLDAYRFDDLDLLYTIAAPVPLPEAA